jgi:hypothetical protein
MESPLITYVLLSEALITVLSQHTQHICSLPNYEILFPSVTPIICSTLLPCLHSIALTNQFLNTSWIQKKPPGPIQTPLFASISYLRGSSGHYQLKCCYSFLRQA